MSLIARSLIVVAVLAAQPAAAQPPGVSSRIVAPPAETFPQSAPAEFSPVNGSRRLAVSTETALEPERSSSGHTSYPPAPPAAVPTMRPTGEAPLPLRRSTARPASSGQASRTAGRGTATGTVLGSLLIVIAAFLLVMWLSRKAAPKGLTLLPSEVLESLGRAPLTARQQMQLVRLGRKLVLLAVTPDGAEPLTEITDSEEVERLCGLCRQHAPGSVSQSFRQVLAQYAREPAPSGFVGPVAVSQLELARGRTSRAEEDVDA